MKSLLILSMLFGSLFISLPISEKTNLDLEMRLDAEEVFTEKVKIYDYSGNLLKEFDVSAVASSQITVTEYLILEESDFAFDYQGDYYYFKEEK